MTAWANSGHILDPADELHHRLLSEPPCHLGLDALKRGVHGNEARHPHAAPANPPSLGPDDGRVRHGIDQSTWMALPRRSLSLSKPP